MLRTGWVREGGGIRYDYRWSGSRDEVVMVGQREDAKIKPESRIEAWEEAAEATSYYCICFPVLDCHLHITTRHNTLFHRNIDITG